MNSPWQLSNRTCARAGKDGASLMDGQFGKFAAQAKEASSKAKSDWSSDRAKSSRAELKANNDKTAHTAVCGANNEREACRLPERI
eukprot:280913-Chlamydomonas_euryale.AAC.5